MGEHMMPKLTALIALLSLAALSGCDYSGRGLQHSHQPYGHELKKPSEAAPERSGGMTHEHAPSGHILKDNK